MEELRQKLQARMDRHTLVIDAHLVEEAEYFKTHGEIMPHQGPYYSRMGRIYELDEIASILGIELTRRV